jgi:hypothetical protein
MRRRAFSLILLVIVIVGRVIWFSPRRRLVLPDF